MAPKGSDMVASNHTPYDVYDGITNVQVPALVDGIEPNRKSGKGSNSKTVHQYKKTTLRSRKKNEGNLTGRRTMFSRVAKQGLLALGRGNDETHYSGWEKIALPVVLVGVSSLIKRQTNMAGTKPVTSKQMREVRKQRGPASGTIDISTNTIDLEKVVPPVPARKIKVPTTISMAAADGRFKARLVTPGWMQRHVSTDRTIVAAKDEFGRSQNGGP